MIDGKQIFVTKYENTSKDSDQKPSKRKVDIRWKAQEDALKEEENIAESGKIFLRNLTYTTTEDDVRKLFEKFGRISAF